MNFKIKHMKIVEKYTNSVEFSRYLARTHLLSHSLTVGVLKEEASAL